MIAYIIRRLIQAGVIILIVTFLVFIVVHLLPGDPVLIYLGRQHFIQLTPERIEELRHEYGLDRPIMVQYGDWMSDVFTGDLGKSLVFREPVTHLIGKRILISLHIGILAFLIAASFGIAVGVISAVKRGKWVDNVAYSLANLGISVPEFWLGIMLMYLISFKLGLLPIHGYTSPLDDFWLSTKQVLLPVFCLALLPLASTARQARSSMLEVAQQDYIRTARAKGLTERIVIQRHLLKNGLIPVVTLLGIDVGAIIGGDVLIETVFNIPGLGRLLVTGLFNRDYAIVQAGVLIAATIVVLSNLIVDISYAWLDPRIRYE